jgi:hypothetical protein
MTINLNEIEFTLIRHTIKTLLAVGKTLPTETAAHLRRISKKLSPSRTRFGRASITTHEAGSLILLLNRTEQNLTKQKDALGDTDTQRALIETLTANYNSIKLVLVEALSKELSHEIIQSQTRGDQGADGSNP